MSAKKRPYHGKAKRGHEAPRVIIPTMSARAQAARGRAMAFLAAGAISPFPDFRNVRNCGRGPWWGH
jgi:hypothetical protein